MKTLFALCGLLFLVAGCTLTDSQRAALVSTCDNLTVLFQHYDVVAETGVISQRTRDRVELARAQTARFCASPETANSLTLLAAATQTYIAVRAALEEGGASTAAWDAFAAETRQLYKQEMNR